jgi:enoyl-CoA hydratase
VLECDVDGAIATVTLDDGKANALSPVMQREINYALDLAEQQEMRAVVLAGNDRLFCGGFDLGVLAAADQQATLDMLRGGFRLSVRLLMFPSPVIIAATGPAIAISSFLLLSGDHRVGSARTRCQAKEVATGMTLPMSAVEIMRMRLTPPAFHRGIAMACRFVGDAAIAGGWLDEIIEPSDVVSRAHEEAETAAATVNLEAHLASKVKARGGAVEAILRGIDRLARESRAGNVVAGCRTSRRSHGSLLLRVGCRRARAPAASCRSVRPWWENSLRQVNHLWISYC